MITVSEYAGQAVGVFGLGKAGEATIVSLLAGKAIVYAADDNASGMETLAKKLGGKVHMQPIAEWPWQQIKALVLSPGIPLTHPKPHAVVELAKRNNCPIIGDIELLYRTCPNARYVGITGTNGKSTTTTLIGHILKEASKKIEVGGNLGTPALALNPLDKDGIYVLETSSYQLDLLQTMRFNVALLLNVTPDHLDRHGDMAGYIKAKKHIFERQQKSDSAIIAVDDEYTQALAKELKTKAAQLVEVSASHRLDNGVYAENAMLHDRLQSKEQAFDLRNIATLTGRHNWQNAAIAYAAARACGITPDVIYKAMQSFGGLRHRLQLVATINGVRFINDSKATNADATSNALAPYENIYWILGGKPKAGGIETLTSYFPKIAHAFLIGQASDEFAATLGSAVKFTRSGTLDVALKQAADMAFSDKKKDAVVLLSPACASFDQFKSFEHRGDVFCDLVSALAKGKAA